MNALPPGHSAPLAVPVDPAAATPRRGGFFISGARRRGKAARVGHWRSPGALAIGMPNSEQLMLSFVLAV
jgi:hypothetical protein